MCRDGRLGALLVPDRITDLLDREHLIRCHADEEQHDRRCDRPRDLESTVLLGRFRVVVVFELDDRVNEHRLNDDGDRDRRIEQRHVEIGDQFVAE